MVAWVADGQVQAEVRHGQQRERCLASAETDAAGDTVLYYQCDHLGTPLELRDEHAELAWAVSYRTWGKVYRHVVKRVEQPFRFQGQYEDQETGLFYNRHRYYDAATARYLSQDPISFFGGENFYVYAPNSTLWSDPLGLAAGKARPGSGWNYNNMPSIPGTQKHHIIPQQLKDHPAMQKSGISIHDPKNIIYLPCNEMNHPPPESK